METLLFFLAILGFGALILAIHVILVGPDAFDHKAQPRNGNAMVGNAVVAASPGVRTAGDRRGGQVVMFPLMVNGALITEDRRLRGDRRQAR